MEWFEYMKSQFPPNEPFLIRLNREQIGEILLKLHTSNRQLDDFAINQLAEQFDKKSFSLDALLAVPIVFDYDTNKLLDGAHKLAGFITSELQDIELMVLFLKDESHIDLYQ